MNLKRIVGAFESAAGALAIAALVSGCCTDRCPPAGTVTGPAPREVDAMLGDISPANIRADVDRLAAFGTRHTLSDTASPTRGIGAARNWIKGEFERIARESGRPTEGPDAIRVYFDSYMAPPDKRRITREVELINVILEIPGADAAARSRRYYMTGHYDSICSDFVDPNCDAPGANDDASGVAALMEAARAMSTRRYDATLVFMATAGEEQGLYGAKLHAERARKEGLDIRADLNNDIMGDPLGWIDPRSVDPETGEHPSASAKEIEEARRTVRLFCEGISNPAAPIPEPVSAAGATSSAAPPPTAGTDPKREAQLRSAHAMGTENDGAARNLARYVAEVAALHSLAVRPMIVYRNDRFLRGGDHTAFIENGFPAAVRFTSLYEDYTRQHQKVETKVVKTTDGREVDVRYGDTPEFVDAEYLTGVARVNAAALAHLANAPPAPEKARIITAKLEHDTTLRWEASKDPSVAGYEVVWRDTTIPFWQGVVPVEGGAAATQVVVPMSKDNVFFGVRAFDKAGYRGPVAIPGAARE